MNLKQILLYSLILFALPAFDANSDVPKSFERAKKLLTEVIYKDQNKTFYCKALFVGKDIKPSRAFASLSQSTRSKRLEWEHIVPAHAFGQSFSEWRSGHPNCVSKRGPFKGRKCAKKINHKFRIMEADMYNLVPAIGEVNQKRSNYSFAMLPNVKPNYPGCEIKISGRKVEAPDAVKGDVARIYMYMDQQYPGHGILSNKNKKLFAAWDKLDPVDSWECTRYKRILKWQGNENAVLKDRCMTLLN